MIEAKKSAPNSFRLSKEDNVILSKVGEGNKTRGLKLLTSYVGEVGVRNFRKLLKEQGIK